jgi:hypothetical protein
MRKLFVSLRKEYQIWADEASIERAQFGGLAEKLQGWQAPRVRSGSPRK